MKHIVGYIVVFCTLAIADAYELSASEFYGKVNYITDGDTFEMQSGGVSVTVRLCGINSPELNEPGYGASRGFLYDQIHNKEVRCIPVGSGTICDGRSPTKSRNRVVAQCFVDGRDLGSVITEAGMACDWIKFSGGYYQRGAKIKGCVDRR